MSIPSPELGVFVVGIPTLVGGPSAHSAYSLTTMRTCVPDGVRLSVTMPVSTRLTFSYHPNSIVPLPGIGRPSQRELEICNLDRTQPWAQAADNPERIGSCCMPPSKGEPVGPMRPRPQMPAWKQPHQSRQAPDIAHRHLKLNREVVSTDAPFAVHQTCRPCEIGWFHGMSISQHGRDMQGTSYARRKNAPVRG